jgi:hypothetical protein
MTFYSLNGADPAPLPKSHLAADGTNYTALAALPDAVLSGLGYVAATDAPAFNPNTHKQSWDGAAWATAALTAEETVARLTSVRAAKLGALQREYRRRSQAGMAFNGIPIATTPDAVAEIKEARDAYADGSLTGTNKVTTRSGKVIPMTSTLATALYQQVVDHKKDYQAAESAHAEYINDPARTAQEIADRDITTGWPS